MQVFLRLLPLVILLAGCAGRQEFTPPKPDEEKYAPPELDYSLPAASKGSLYRHQYTMTLFQDRRAYRVGDMLTVLLFQARKLIQNMARAPVLVLQPLRLVLRQLMS